MEEIIEGILGEEERISSIKVFPRLDCLYLCNLPRLRRVCSGINPIEFCFLRVLIISGCPVLGLFHCDDILMDEYHCVFGPHYFFNEKVSFPVLEKLDISDYDYGGLWWRNQLAENSFSKLISFELRGCYKLLNVFPLSMWTKLQRIKYLKIEHCESLKEIFESQQEDGSSTESGENQHGISSQHPLFWANKVSLPMLERLDIKHMDKLKRLWWPNQLAEHSFPKLISIDLENCDKLLNVFPLSLLTTLQRLDHLSIRLCVLLEEIIFESQFQEDGSSSDVQSLSQQLIQSDVITFQEEGSSSDIQSLSQQLIQSDVITFEFYQMTSLCLDGLPNLKSFYHKMHTIKWPSLKEMTVCGCNKVEILFASQETSEKSQQEISIQQPLFWVNEVSLPVLEKLNINFMKNLKRLWWSNQLAEHSFSKLISIDLVRCEKLLNVFPLSMLTTLQMLDRLRIWDCALLEEIIFESQFREECSSSAIQSLSPQLIQSDVITFEFSRLTSLCLDGLPKLKSFYHKIHTTNWPSLKEMTVDGCDKVEILFASQETSERSQQEIPILQPLFWVNEFTFPNLHQLTLGWNHGMKKIWHCYGYGYGQQQQLLSHYFPNLKVVKLDRYPEQLTVLPSYLFQLISLPNLETLEMNFSYFKEIFQSEEGDGGEEKPAWVVLSRITELKLLFHRELMHLWKEKDGFQNLRILLVDMCHKLKYLVPSSVSFQNLVTLEVRRCDGIIKLVTHSTAKSLVQLREMTISDCERIEEIIEGEDDNDEINFPQLNSLKLDSLPKLESFCASGNYTFGFPSLQTVIVKDCPKMKMFSQGKSNTPRLHKVQLDDGLNEWRWKGSLNSTIQQLFKEWNTVEEVQRSIEDQGNPSTSNTVTQTV